MIKDDIKTGNGKEIIQAAYRIVGAIDRLPPARQVQAVAAVFIALVNVLDIKPADLMGLVDRIINSEESYRTTKALMGYIEEELKDV